MKNRHKTGKGKGSGTKDHTLHDQSQESVGGHKMGAAYGQSKGPKQHMAGAVKKAALPQKVKRAAGSSYAGSSEGSHPA